MSNHSTKALMAGRTVHRVGCVLGLMLLLSGCGYKGPLYMPPPPAAPDEELTTPPATQQGLPATVAPSAAPSGAPSDAQSQAPGFSPR